LLELAELLVVDVGERNHVAVTSETCTRSLCDARNVVEGEGTGQNIQRMEKIEKERMNNSDDIRRRETCVCLCE